jgi:hypothetical protein
MNYLSSDMILAVSIDCELDVLSGYDWVQEGLPYREWLIPSDFGTNARSRLSKWGPTFGRVERRRSLSRW